MSSAAMFRAVPSEGIVLRGSSSPWSIIRDEVARRLGIDPGDLPVAAVHLAPGQYAQAANEARLYVMLGFDAGPSCSMRRGVQPGFALVPKFFTDPVTP